MTFCSSNSDELLTYCILIDYSTFICWIKEVSGLFYRFYSISDGKSCEQNTEDPDQMPHYVASDLGLHCLPVTLSQVSL